MVNYAAHGKGRSLPTQELWDHMHLKMSTVGVEGKNCGIYSVASQHVSENQGWKWRNSWWPEIITIAHFIYGLIAHKVLSDTLSHYILTKSLGGKGKNHLVPFHRWGRWDTKRLVLFQGQLQFVSVGSPGLNVSKTFHSQAGDKVKGVPSLFHPCTCQSSNHRTSLFLPNTNFLQ